MHVSVQYLIGQRPEAGQSIDRTLRQRIKDGFVRAFDHDLDRGVVIWNGERLLRWLTIGGARRGGQVLEYRLDSPDIEAVVEEDGGLSRVVRHADSKRAQSVNQHRVV